MALVKNAAIQIDHRQVKKHKTDKNKLSTKHLFTQKMFNKKNSIHLNEAHHAVGQAFYYTKHEPLLMTSKQIAQQNHELTLLIKKICINFYQPEAHFIINHGIFSGTKFSIKKRNKQLIITVRNASHKGRVLLQQNISTLKHRLLQHEIFLKEMRFIDQC